MRSRHERLRTPAPLALLLTSIACQLVDNPNLGGGSGTDTNGTTSTGTTSTSTTDETEDTSDTTGPPLCDDPPAPTLTLEAMEIKQFAFSWDAVDADYHQLLESPTMGEPFGQIGEDIVETSISVTVPLHLRWDASYQLRACRDCEGMTRCTDSNPVPVMASLATEGIGYIKASNPGAGRRFGRRLALSEDGRTLAVSAFNAVDGGPGQQAQPGDFGAVYIFAPNDEGSWSLQHEVQPMPIDGGFGFGLSLSDDGDTLAVGNPRDDLGSDDSGVVHVFVRNDMDEWQEESTIKQTNPGLEAGDFFGHRLALSGDGDTLAVGAWAKDGFTGGVYVFTRSGPDWDQEEYIQATDPDLDDAFGFQVALSDDGDTLAVGALNEDSNATGVGGDSANDDAGQAGAAYVFVRDESEWSQQEYIKPTNTGMGDEFGLGLSLSGDGNRLAVGARLEDSDGSDEGSDSAADSGAVYVFDRNDMGAWTQLPVLKAPNLGMGDQFGVSVDLSDGGNLLAVGTWREDSNSAGLEGDEDDDSFPESGAAYVFQWDGATWSPRTYVKATNPDAGDEFGIHLALGQDGRILAVGAGGEDSGAMGVGGDQGNDGRTLESGAVYLY